MEKKEHTTYKHIWKYWKVKEDDTGKQLVFRCDCGAQKYGNVIYYESCAVITDEESILWEKYPCLCSQSRMKKFHNPTP